MRKIINFYKAMLLSVKIGQVGDIGIALAGYSHHAKSVTILHNHRQS
jgi:hypothetical protein